MKILVIEPYGCMGLQEIDGSLESMQQVVGGYIETITRTPYVLVCDENGRLSGKAENVSGLCGTVFICRKQEDRLVGLCDADIKPLTCRIKELLADEGQRQWEAYRRLCLLGAKQRLKETGICPRCGRKRMASPLTSNALSRYADIYICSQCGLEEAIADYQSCSDCCLSDWAALRRQKL